MKLSDKSKNKDRDSGGRILPGKKYWLNNFIVEVCVESPGDVDEFEAMEDAADFMESVRHTSARVSKSFCKITRVDEVGPKRPERMGVKIENKKTWPKPLSNTPSKKMKPKKAVKKGKRI